MTAAKPRGWWHDEARQMCAKGIGRRAIAKHFGLSLHSVSFLLSEKVRESTLRRSREYRAKKRQAAT